MDSTKRLEHLEAQLNQYACDVAFGAPVNNQEVADAIRRILASKPEAASATDESLIQLFTEILGEFPPDASLNFKLNPNRKLVALLGTRQGYIAFNLASDHFESSNLDLDRVAWIALQATWLKTKLKLQRTEMVNVMRRPCIQEDEGQHSFVARKPRADAENWIAAQATEYFKPSDYYIQ